MKNTDGVSIVNRHACLEQGDIAVEVKVLLVMLDQICWTDVMPLCRACKTREK